MLLTTVVIKISSRVLPASAVDIVLIAPAEHQFLAPVSFTEDLDRIPEYRHKREAYDPYDAYYFYPSSLNQRAPSQYDRQDTENSLINRRDAEQSNRIDGHNGQKYKYTPLFQYKSTQSRRRKLFVPNLFG